VITRFLLVERPDDALPEATRKDQPIELSAPSEHEAEEIARARGCTLLVVRLGQRQLSPDEMAAQAIPGTILMPGEHALPPARDLPCVPWTCLPIWCIPDGGDFGQQAGNDRDGRLRGLDPGDTVAQYADSCGRLHIAVSNRVCLCVPRFLVVRTENMPVARLALVGPFDTEAVKAPALLEGTAPPLEKHQVELPSALLGRLRPSGSIFVTGPVVVGRVQGAEVVATAEVTAIVTGSCPKPPPPPEKPLLIIKWPDRCGAEVGDIVTFYLKYSNHGGQPITDIAVSDSLAARFEYVPGSAKSDRDAVFTMQPNEAGSIIVRWEVAGALPPGQSGMVSFQVRIR
jgi:uncharacterized repeat protein (TIGR01451 family)